ncbi:hypothetical protein Ancab_018096 [Ancistrocladus abbreviatus]
MLTVSEAEEYNWREVKLPSLIPKVPEPELERENCERRRGRDILIAVDHGPNSKHAFDWALVHLCRLADTIHLVHAVSDVNDEAVYEATETLMENLAVEALQVAMVNRTVARIVEGDARKVICKEAERFKPAAVVMGTRGRGLVQSVLQGSVSEYCYHHCRIAPLIIVPGKVGDIAEKKHKTGYSSELVIDAVFDCEEKLGEDNGSDWGRLCRKGNFKEAERLELVAVFMGARCRGWVQGSISVASKFHHCKTAPIIVVPWKVEVGEQSVIYLRSTKHHVPTLGIPIKCRSSGCNLMVAQPPQGLSEIAQSPKVKPAWYKLAMLPHQGCAGAVSEATWSVVRCLAIALMMRCRAHLMHMLIEHIDRIADGLATSHVGSIFVLGQGICPLGLGFCYLGEECVRALILFHLPGREVRVEALVRTLGKEQSSISQPRVGLRARRGCTLHLELVYATSLKELWKSMRFPASHLHSGVTNHPKDGKRE